MTNTKAMCNNIPMLAKLFYNELEVRGQLYCPSQGLPSVDLIGSSYGGLSNSLDWPLF